MIRTLSVLLKAGKLLVYFICSVLLCLSFFHCEAQKAKNVYLLCNWRDTAHCPANAGGQYWNDVWGLVNKGKEYAVIGGTAGAHIIDLDACTEVAFLPGRSQGVSHRDYKTYGHYLYAASDEGYASLQVFDFSTLPDAPRLVWESTLSDISRAHTIFIDTAKAKLYCCSSNNTSNGSDDLRIYSLADPTHPLLLGVVNEFFRTHALYARNDTAWCSNGYYGMVMLGMSALPDYTLLGRLTGYPQQGFNHSSWIGPDGIGVMTDENFGKAVKMIDTRNPAKAIRVLSTFAAHPGDTISVAHNPYLLGHYAVISYYMDGLQIFDVSDPLHPVQTGYYDTYPGQTIQSYLGAWGCYPFLPSRRILISDMQTGLYVFNAEEALGGPAPQQCFIFPNPTSSDVRMLLPSTVSGPVKVVIYNSTGSLIYQSEQLLQAGENTALQVSLPGSMPAGLYVFRAYAGGQSFSARFIKR